MSEYQNAVEKLVLSKKRETTIYEMLKIWVDSAEKRRSPNADCNEV